MLKLVLFELSTPASIDALDRLSRAQIEKYGDRGLRAVPVDHMPAAVDALFATFGFLPGQRLLEIGPGPYGGFSLISALMGLDAIVVEYDRSFQVDVDLLRQQLSASPGTEAALAHIAGLSGTVEVSQIDRLRRTLQPYDSLVATVGGSIQVIPGDFADSDVQLQVNDLGPFDHVICTDVVSPMQHAFSNTTAMLTTGEDEKTLAILAGVAQAAADARTLYTGFIVPEQSDEFGQQIARLYDVIESALREHGRTSRHEAVISPSSATVLRSRLYHLADTA